MRYYEELGSTPCNEDCVQVSRTEDYVIPMKQEIKRYIDLLRTRFPFVEPEKFSIKSFPHDFGTYYEAVIYLDNEDEQQEKIGLFVIDHLPETWNDQVVYNLEDVNKYFESRLDEIE